MASMHDLIEQIEDARLRERLRQEWEASVREKKFGLVFEPHLPELLPLPKVKPRRGDLVCMREGSLKDLWRVRRVANGVAFCVKPGADGQGGPVDPVQFSLDELLVVRQFGEPIFPALVPVDQVQNGDAGAPWHTLIEADNFHALQLLDYLYAGKVDCIYIDPPYNTGARDWKYNNDYVDGNDGWRHSKWLAFMEKRLKLAGRLLKPETGVLIVTIDEHEVHHLGMLLEEVFPQSLRQLVTIVINQKGVSQGRLSRVEEYAIYCFSPGVTVQPHSDDLLSPDRSQEKRFQTPRWEWLQRGGNNANPDARHGLFYPIHIDPTKKRITSVGQPLPKGSRPAPGDLGADKIAWPIRRDGSYATWQVGPKTLEQLIENRFVRLGGYDKKRQTWTIQYLGSKSQRQIEEGVLQVVGTDEIRGCVEVAYATAEQRSLKTVWHRQLHDSGVYGSAFLKAILNRPGAFSFPKSIYSTRDAIDAVVRDRPKALIVDFFAGSGTTLNAVNLINAIDGGQRRCILVTNNEVSAEDTATLSASGFQPGDPEWEAQGICRAVTWLRSKFTILGCRDDRSVLSGDYLTGKKVDLEKDRSFTQIGFVAPAALDAPARKKQVVALIHGLPQTLVKGPCPFIVSEDHKASVLFETAAAAEWLEALEGQDHITDFYIVEPVKSVFDSLKDQVMELLGPLVVPEDEKRSMSSGFSANLAYFKLDFLDKDRVALKQAFKEVLPILWLKAGAVGPRPELPKSAAEPSFFDPSGTNFTVLLDEGAFRKFVKTIGKRADLTVVYIVTDADEAFKDMADEVRQALRLASPGVEVVQLYKDYLANFLINTRLDHDLNGQGGQA